MFDFICALLTGIGFTISIFGIGYGITSVVDSIKKANRQRDERFTQIITAIERIEANTRSNSDHA